MKGVELISLEDQKEQLVAMGIDPTEEMITHVAQIIDDALAGGNLSKPFLTAGAIKVFEDRVGGIGIIRGVALHKTKFPEMLKNPNSYSD